MKNRKKKMSGVSVDVNGEVNLVGGGGGGSGGGGSGRM